MLVSIPCPLCYAADQESQCHISAMPQATTYVNTSLSTVILLVQFFDWASNDDARGSVRYIDTNGDGIPDTRQYDGYHYQDYWNLVFSTATYVGSAHPDYNGYYNFDKDYRVGQRLTVYGSMKDYWLEVSYGNLNIVPGITRVGQSGIVNHILANNVIEWITLTQPKSYYQTPYGYTLIGPDAISAAISLYQRGLLDIDVRNYQRVLVMTAGSINGINTNTVGSVSQSYVAGWYFTGYEKYRQNNMTDMGRLTHINIFTHEFGHTLTFPDLHDWFYTPGVSHYCLMGPPRPLDGPSPPHVNPRDKLRAGWLGYVLVNQPTYTPLSNQFLPLTLPPSDGPSVIL